MAERGGSLLAGARQLLFAVKTFLGTETELQVRHAAALNVVHGDDLTLLRRRGGRDEPAEARAAQL